MGSGIELVAKLARPGHKNIFSRTRLHEKLKEQLGNSSVWISGPPGSGKTTFVSSFIEQARIAHIWYQIDERDSDVAAFFNYLSVAARTIAGREDAALPECTVAHRKGLNAFALRYFEHLFRVLPANFVLVLDDYHLAGHGSELDAVLLHGFESLPKGGKIVCVSRHELPAAFCRLVGNQKLGVISAKELRLTAEEASGIARLHRPDLDETRIKTLHEQTDGWATGLMFGMQNVSLEQDRGTPTDNDHELLFGYFASEVVAQLETDTRRLITQLSLLPVISKSTALALTGDTRAGTLLKTFYRKNYFVSRHKRGVAQYTLHPLFRTFLLGQLEQEWKPAELFALRCKAARILEQMAFPDAALSLYREAAAWPEVARLVSIHAAYLYRQGRLRYLVDIIDSLPEYVIAEQPWLRYWQGMCLMIMDTAEAFPRFAQAFEDFRRTEDDSGALAAWAGGLNAILAEWRETGRIADWLDKGEPLLPAGSNLPSDEFGAGAVAAMCFGLFIARPHSPRLPDFIRVTHALLVSSDNRTFSLMGGNLLLVFYAWRGDLISGQALIDALANGIESEAPSETQQVLWGAAQAWHQLVTGDARQSLQTCRQSLEQAKHIGIRVFDYRFLSMAAQASLLLGDTAGAEGYLKLYNKEVCSAPRTLLHFHMHFLRGWERWLNNETELAAHHLQVAQDYLVEASLPPIVTAKVNLARAALELSTGNQARAETNLEIVQHVANTTESAWLQYHCWLLGAELARRREAKSDCLALLRSALTLARRHRLVTTDWWDPTMMSKLLALAIHSKIEPEYARHIIDAAGLQAPEDPHAALSWPWHAEVKMLGSFALTIPEHTFDSGAKQQKKVLELLKFLLVSGNRPVSAARAVDVLWPDADGDAALNALKTNVYRLRKLLQSSEAVEYGSGFVSLNPKRVRSDLTSFEALAATPAQSAVRIRNVKRALKLYRGELLADENEQSWIPRPRHRIARQARSMTRELGAFFAAKCRWSKAIELYRNWLRQNPGDEQVLRDLMNCYHHSGRDAEALEVYESCRQYLVDQNSKHPSVKTQSLAKSLEAAAHH